MKKLIYPVFILSLSLSGFAASKSSHDASQAGPRGTSRSIASGKSFDQLKVGAGSFLFGVSVVTRVTNDIFLVCALGGYECAQAANITEVQSILETQKDLKDEGEPGTISEILAKVDEEGAKDYVLDPKLLETAARDPKAMQKLVADLVNVEEAFSSRVNTILHSDLAKNLKDDAKQMLSALIFGDRARVIQSKLTPALQALDEVNKVQDPRIDALKNMLTGKEGFQRIFAETYKSAEEEQARKQGQVFSDVGCPACTIARNLESELPALVGMSRKQVPKGNKITTPDGQTFLTDGKSYVVRKDKNSSLKVIDDKGQETNMNSAGDPTHKKLLQAYLDYANAPKGNKPTQMTAAAAPTPAAPVATADWAKGITVSNDRIAPQYQGELRAALAEPNEVAAARRLFRLGPFYQGQKRSKVDGFLNDSRFEAKAPGLLREFLSNRSSQYRHCPSCWLGERFNWNPTH